MTDATALLREGAERYEALDYDAALDAWARARALAREDGDASTELRALSNTGEMLIGAGRALDARPILEEALACAEQRPSDARAEPREHRRVLRNLAWACELDEDDEGVERCRAKLRASYDQSPAGARERALFLGNEAVRAHVRGDLEEAELQYLETIDLCHAAGERRALGHALENLANLRSSYGKMEGVRAMYEEALRIHTQENNVVGVASATGLLGTALFVEEDFAGAVRLWRDAAARYDAIGNRANATQIRINLAWAALEQGAPDDAAAALERALEDARALNNEAVEGDALDAMGLHRRVTGDLGAAVAFHREAAAKLEAGRRFDRVSVAELHEGIALALAGDHEAADARLERTARRAQESEDPTTTADALVWRALLAWRARGVEAGRALLEEAERFEARAGSPRLTRVVLAAHAALDGKRVELDTVPGRAVRAFAEGAE